MKRVTAKLPYDPENLWAKGCTKCKFGIVSAPELTGACELYLERLVQALNGDVQFCTCQAGTRYRVFLLNRNLKLKAEAKRHQLMADYAQRGTHLDIEVARVAMENSYVYAAPPPMHLETAGAAA